VRTTDEGFEMARSTQNQFDKDQNRFRDQDDNRDWAPCQDRDQMGRGHQGFGGEYGRGSDDMWG
jgi:hypothetical protein